MFNQQGMMQLLQQIQQFTNNSQTPKFTMQSQFPNSFSQGPSLLSNMQAMSQRMSSPWGGNSFSNPMVRMPSMSQMGGGFNPYGFNYPMQMKLSPNSPNPFAQPQQQQQQQVPAPTIVPPAVSPAPQAAPVPAPMAPPPAQQQLSWQDRFNALSPQQQNSYNTLKKQYDTAYNNWRGGVNSWGNSALGALKQKMNAIIQ